MKKKGSYIPGSRTDAERKGRRERAMKRARARGPIPPPTMPVRPLPPGESPPPGTGPYRKPNGQLVGGHRGSGGKPGRSGSVGRSKLWLARCQKMLLNVGTQKSIRTILRNPNHPAFPTLLKILRDSGYPAKQQLDIKARLSLEDLLTHANQLAAEDDA